jgi:hypothetical protein
MPVRVFNFAANNTGLTRSVQKLIRGENGPLCGLPVIVTNDATQHLSTTDGALIRNGFKA